MNYRQLGSAGARVSAIGLGSNRLGMPGKVPQEEVNRIIDTAQEVGINFIDTANLYQGGKSEETLGVALKGRWDRFVLATKFRYKTGPGPNDYGASRYQLSVALDASLRRLQSDHIDLYYVHDWDAETPIDETLRALDDAVRTGKIRYVGASNFMAWQLAYSNLLAELRGWSSFVCIQSEYHMFSRSVEREVIPYCQAMHVGFVPYFPLAGGFLTGKYRRGQPAPSGSRGEGSPYVQEFMTDKLYDRLEQLIAWAKDHGYEMNDLAQAWLLAQPSVCSVITGATRAEQVIQNARAGDWILTKDEIDEINQILNAEAA
jgi:aryl-alcohol dehydrogenase-like predicted oxidoreductase